VPPQLRHASAGRWRKRRGPGWDRRAPGRDDAVPLHACHWRQFWFGPRCHSV